MTICKTSNVLDFYSILKYLNRNDTRVSNFWSGQVTVKSLLLNLFLNKISSLILIIMDILNEFGWGILDFGYYAVDQNVEFYITT